MTDQIFHLTVQVWITPVEEAVEEEESVPETDG